MACNIINGKKPNPKLPFPATSFFTAFFFSLFPPPAFWGLGDAQSWGR